MIPGAAATAAAANRRSIPVVMVTNQAGIRRGLYGWFEFAQVQEAIYLALAKQGPASTRSMPVPTIPADREGWRIPITRRASQSRHAIARSDGP
jgi:histidinol phosphatase-like enzyme